MFEKAILRSSATTSSSFSSARWIAARRPASIAAAMDTFVNSRAPCCLAVLALYPAFFAAAVAFSEIKYSATNRSALGARRSACDRFPRLAGFLVVIVAPLLPLAHWPLYSLPEFSRIGAIHHLHHRRAV